MKALKIAGKTKVGLFSNCNPNIIKEPREFKKTKNTRLFTNYQKTTKTTDQNIKKPQRSDFELNVIIGNQRAGVIITLIKKCIPFTS